MKTEAAIMKATERLMHGRTTFMIAHHLSTLDQCDIRLELEHGQIVWIKSTWASPTPAGNDSRIELGDPVFALPEADPADLPAAQAWLKLGHNFAIPEKIECLKEKSQPMIYRMVGVGPDCSNVIAKRCSPAAAIIEKVIYEDILPRIPFTALRSYRVVDERGENGNKGACWLFMEDAGGEPYSPFREDHRLLASEWLGMLHTTAASIPAGSESARPWAGMLSPLGTNLT